MDIWLFDISASMGLVLCPCSINLIIAIEGSVPTHPQEEDLEVAMPGKRVVERGLSFPHTEPQACRRTHP